ncbi:MFS transporter [Gordonia sp. (in: high G+C Gram-positive bacteria)]|uniref:MFS transporter n=1 Tax=Gordonia sp. (in: high G+C Gram-positive bacteria) TaxID=84139 RepID=UPI0039E410E3
MRPTTPRHEAAGGVLRHANSLTAILAIACLAQFMVVLDGTIVTVALPAMRTDLGLGAAGQQWVVSAYLIPLGGLLLLAARAADLYGRRRVFVVGAVVFTLASLAGGLAETEAVLLGARVAQGVGAAALAPASLSLIMATHPEGSIRQRGLTLWSVMGGAAGTVGVVAGGLLTAAFGWRAVLFVNVPIGAALVAATYATMRGDRALARRPSLDLPGSLTATLGFGTLTFALSEVGVHGWGSSTVAFGLMASAVLIAAFILIESAAPDPLIPRGLLRPRAARIGNTLMVLMGAMMTSSIYLMSIYLQHVLGYSALRAGLALVPMTVVLVLGGLTARRLVAPVGVRRMAIGGALVSTAGLAALGRLPAHPSAFVTHLLVPMVVTALGLSTMLLAVTLAVTTDVDAEVSGAASGLLNSARQLGGGVGLAVLATVAAEALSSPASAESAVHGYRLAFLVNAGVLLVGAVVALALPRADRATARTLATTTGGDQS